MKRVKVLTVKESAEFAAKEPAAYCYRLFELLYNTFFISSGKGAVKSMGLPVMGWEKVSLQECRAWRVISSISG